METGAERCLDALVGASLLQRLSGLLMVCGGDVLDTTRPLCHGDWLVPIRRLCSTAGARGSSGEGATFEAIALRRRPERIRGVYRGIDRNPASPG